MTNSFCVHPQRSRKRQHEAGELSNTLPRLLTSSWQKRCIKGPSLQIQQSTAAQWQAGTQIMDWEEGHPIGAPPRAVLRKPLLHCPGVTLIKMRQWWSTFQTERCYCLGVWDTWDWARVLMGCLVEEPKAGEGVDLGDLWRNKCERDGETKRAKHMYIAHSTVPLSGHVLHSILLHSISVSLGEDSILCPCVYVRVQLPATGSDNRLVSPCICVSWNWSKRGSGYQKLEWDHGSESLCVHGAYNCRECEYVRQCVIAREDQAGLGSK